VNFMYNPILAAIYNFRAGIQLETGRLSTISAPQFPLCAFVFVHFETSR
jgi:hypothetical protein